VTLAATVFGSTLQRLPAALRERGGRAAALRAAGYSEAEIAAVLGGSERTLHRDRLKVCATLIAVLREDGYTDTEIVRDHGIGIDQLPVEAPVPEPVDA